MKKILFILPMIIILILTGCSNNETAKVKTNHESKQEKVIATAQKNGKIQKQTLKNMKKGYVASSESIIVGSRPTKLADFTTGKHNSLKIENKGIVLKGIVTDWTNAQRYNGQVMTKVSFYVNNQLNYKAENNMTGKTISIYMLGGNTTLGEQSKSVPEKSFGEKQKLTQSQEKEKVFIDDAKTPLPRIGDQLLVAVQPFDLKESGKLNYDFNIKIKFDKDMPYQLAAKEYSVFNLNTKTHKYESKVIDNNGKLTNRVVPQIIDYVGNSENESTAPEDLPEDLQSLLKDINSNYN